MADKQDPRYIYILSNHLSFSLSKNIASCWTSLVILFDSPGYSVSFWFTPSQHEKGKDDPKKEIALTL